MKNKEKGMITVEASIVLVIFLSMMAAMVTVIKIHIVHNKVQYAISQTANRYSSYLYLYEGLGINDMMKKLDKNIDIATEDLNETSKDIHDVIDTGDKIVDEGKKVYSDGKEFLANQSQLVDNIISIIDQLGAVGGYIGNADFEGLESSVSGIENSYNSAESNLGNMRDSYSSAAASVDVIKADYATLKSQLNQTGSDMKEWADKIKENPYSLLLTIIYAAADELEDQAKGRLSELLCGVMTSNYIDDKELTACGVEDGYEGLDFEGSNFFNTIRASESSKTDNVEIDIVVTYKVKVAFPLIPLEDNELTIIQCCSEFAWCGTSDTVG